MKRRSFLKRLCTVPVIGLVPSLGFAHGRVCHNETIEQYGLDRIINIIDSDKRLKRKLDRDDIVVAIESAKKMNHIILEAIIETGVANDKRISIADTREINDYIFYHYREEWIELYGNKSDNIGFNKILKDVAKTKIFGKNAIDVVFDTIYHLGFETYQKNNLLNEDANIGYKEVSIWLDRLLKKDLEKGTLLNPNIKEVIPNSETGLDMIVDIIYSDNGINHNISTGDIRVGANSANEMNMLILESIDATNGGNGGLFTIDDIKSINQILLDKYAMEWKVLYRDYQKVSNHNATTKLFERDAINVVFDEIYHLGDKNEDNHIEFKKIAQWFNLLLEDKLDNNTEDLQILIPLYIYPNTDWKNLIDIRNKYQNIEITAIINPDLNGHFTESDDNYITAIKELFDADINVIGYVYTQYAKRNTQDVIDDISMWVEFYKESGISGIFFDEVSADSVDFDYYATLSDEARARGLDFIVLNPGMTTDVVYIDSGIADIVVTYEVPHKELLDNPSSSYNTPTDVTKLSTLIYEMEGDSIDDLIYFSRENNFEYIYFTEDGFDGNPWDSISNYFEDQVAKATL